MSFTNLIDHIVFSTKERRPLLLPEVRPRICRYVGGIVRNLKGIPLAINGVTDHIHIAAVLHPTVAPSDFVGKIKSNSSGWIHDTFPDMRDFRWQDGYSAFSVSQSLKDTVVAYIVNQEQHHKRMTFQEELVALLDKHGIEYDERYIWK